MKLGWGMLLSTVASAEAPASNAPAAAAGEALLAAHVCAFVVAPANALEDVAWRLAQPRLRLLCHFEIEDIRNKKLNAKTKGHQPIILEGKKKKESTPIQSAFSTEKNDSREERRKRRRRSSRPMKLFFSMKLLCFYFLHRMESREMFEGLFYKGGQHLHEEKALFLYKCLRPPVSQRHILFPFLQPLDFQAHTTFPFLFSSSQQFIFLSILNACLILSLLWPGHGCTSPINSMPQVLGCK